MNNSFKKSSAFIFIGLCLFLFFWWLFNMGIPAAAREFALGLTIILMVGFLSGRYFSRLWKDKNNRFQNYLILFLSAGILFGIVGIAWLVNKMINHTEFFLFALTILQLFLISAFLGAVISIFNHRIKKEIQLARTASAHSKSELQLLQSQLSPHFLFNTLNNLYGLSITDHEKLPHLLLKLSDLLRYSVYETKEIFVSLTDEISYLKNYIDFEKIRLSERLDIRINFPVQVDVKFKIAPMLLIVFVENAFKHAGNTYEKKIYIDIKLVLLDQHLLFTISNSFQQAALKTPGIHKNSGFGLDNVKKRLDLLYKDEYVLKIDKSEKEFNVDLKLYTK